MLKQNTIIKRKLSFKRFYVGQWNGCGRKY